MRADYGGRSLNAWSHNYARNYLSKAQFASIPNIRICRYGKIIGVGIDFGLGPFFNKYVASFFSRLSIFASIDRQLEVYRAHTITQTATIDYIFGPCAAFNGNGCIGNNSFELYGD